MALNLDDQVTSKPTDYELNQHNFNVLEAGSDWEIESKTIAAHVAKTKPESVLDVGCRNGYALEVIREKSPETRIVGIDIDLQFVENTIMKNISARVADIHDLPFKDREFTWVMCIQTLEHAYDVERALANLCRVADHGIVISVPLQGKGAYSKNPSHYAYSTRALDWLSLFTIDYGRGTRILDFDLLQATVVNCRTTLQVLLART